MLFYLLAKKVNAHAGICQRQSLKELYFIVQRVLEIPRRTEEENRGREETDGGDFEIRKVVLPKNKKKINLRNMTQRKTV